MKKTTYSAAGLSAALVVAIGVSAQTQQDVAESTAVPVELPVGEICSTTIKPEQYQRVDDGKVASENPSNTKDMMTMSEAGAQHSHPARPVDPDLPMPNLSHLVFPDAMDGYNVQILPRNFTFTPAAINRDVVPNEGHAHVYINGVKIARIYSNWYHLPSSLFAPGVNAVSVTLNANDHSTWALPDGALIVSTVPVVRLADAK